MTPLRMRAQSGLISIGSPRRGHTSRQVWYGSVCRNQTPLQLASHAGAQPSTRKRQPNSPYPTKHGFSNNPYSRPSRKPNRLAMGKQRVPRRAYLVLGDEFPPLVNARRLYGPSEQNQTLEDNRWRIPICMRLLPYQLKAIQAIWWDQDGIWTGVQASLGLRPLTILIHRGRYDQLCMFRCTSLQFIA